MPVPKSQIDAAEIQIAEQTKRIEFFLTEYSVELLAKKMHDKEFEIPTYQRADTWEPERKSRFIESLLMGLPIPFLFFWEKQEGRLEIVDGSQRLRTLEQFILGDFVVGSVSVLTHLEGMRFKDLPISRQRKINNRSIRGIVLNEHADDEARFEIFDRINTGSKIANNAEVRRGALTGPFLDLVIQLASDPVFTSLAPMPDKNINVRDREELVTRFFAYSDGLEGYHDRPSEFLFKYSKKMNQVFEEDSSLIPKYQDRFVSTMAFIANVFPYGFRRNSKGKATPRTRFEAISIGSFFALRERRSLSTQRPYVEKWITEKAFLDVIGSEGANAVSRLKNRIAYVHDKLLGR